MLSVAGRIAECAEHFARHDAHGYSQYHRGDGGPERVALSDGSGATISASDVDCSEMVRQCANVGLATEAIAYMWTGNEDAELARVGFERLPYKMTGVRRGDILLRDGHTAVALGGGNIAEAAADEDGGIAGPRRGDQTGREVRVAALSSNWVSMYRWPSDVPPLLPVQAPGEPVNDVGMSYRAHVAYAGWMPAVRDGQVAGTVGCSAAVEALKIRPPEGLVLDVIAHVQDVGSLAYEDVRADAPRSGTGSSDGDPIVGTVGMGRRLEAVTLHAKRNDTGMALRYQGHVEGIGWTETVGAGQRCGTRGKGLRLEAIRIWME